MSIEGKNFLTVSYVQGYADATLGVLERRGATGAAVDSYDKAFAALDQAAQEDGTKFDAVIISDRTWPKKRKAELEVLSKIVEKYKLPAFLYTHFSTARDALPAGTFDIDYASSVNELADALQQGIESFAALHPQRSKVSKEAIEACAAFLHSNNAIDKSSAALPQLKKPPRKTRAKQKTLHS